MSRERRACILVDEDLNKTDIKMDAFKEYTRASCLLECRDDFQLNFLKIWVKLVKCSNFSIKVVQKCTVRKYSVL